VAEPAPAPEAPAEPAQVEEGVVPVESLLFRGEAALREALRLRPEVERLAATDDGAALRARLDELFDLVALGMEGTPAP
ncbi:MAG TPA: hypothetical protein VHG51_08835, partial [Longimicrobiaceae bacterium]|nr:hypothetical protein [Longimicrobiaceae bacterium]